MKLFKPRDPNVKLFVANSIVELFLRRLIVKLKRTVSSRIPLLYLSALKLLSHIYIYIFSKKSRPEYTNLLREPSRQLKLFDEQLLLLRENLHREAGRQQLRVDAPVARRVAEMTGGQRGINQGV